MSVLDEALTAAARAAGDQVASRLLDQLDERLERAVERVLDRRRDDSLQPLNKLRGGTAASARMFVGRNPDLAALGVQVGKRLLFRRSDWEVWCLAHRKGAR